MTPHPARDTALITGASSGIGEALAACFARGGHDLVLVARSADKLRDTAGALQARHAIQALVLPCDLSLPDAAAGLAAKLKRRRHAASNFCAAPGCARSAGSAMALIL